MKRFSRIGLAAVFSICIALGLSAVMHGFDLNRSKVPSEPIHLTDHNLVDFISQVQMQNRISRVDWTEPVLIIDLKWPEEAARSTLYDDYAQLLSNAFVQTKNVDRLFIRALEWREDDRSELKEWLQADREHFFMQDYADWTNREITSEGWIKQRFELKGSRA